MSEEDLCKEHERVSNFDDGYEEVEIEKEMTHKPATNEQMMAEGLVEETRRQLVKHPKSMDAEPSYYRKMKSHHDLEIIVTSKEAQAQHRPNSWLSINCFSCRYFT